MSEEAPGLENLSLVLPDSDKTEKKKLEATDDSKKRRQDIENTTAVNNNSSRCSRESSDHEVHIFTERERRKKMKTMFANLHALLPHLPPKADKSMIVDEAVRYIRSLQQTLQKLQTQKLERLQQSAAIATTPQNKEAANSSDSREAFLADHHHRGQTDCDLAADSSPPFPVLFQTWTSSNVVLNICGSAAQISVFAPNKAGLFTAICYVLEKHNIEVVSAHVSSDAHRCMYMIQAHHVTGVSSQLSEALQVEEMYKQAAREIMRWVSS